MSWSPRTDRFAEIMADAGFPVDDWIVEFPRFVPAEIRDLPYWQGKDCFRAYHTLKNPVEPYHCSIKLEEAAALYGLVRMMQPEVVVEAGCNNGCSTAAIALALRDNGHGRLDTCDLKSMWVEKCSDRLSMLLPESRFSVSKCTGEELLKRTPDLDLFWHDSYHVEAVVVPEIEAAMECLRPHGLLTFHDVNMVYEPGAGSDEMVRVLGDQAKRYSMPLIRGMSNPGIAIMQKVA